MPAPPPAPRREHSRRNPTVGHPLQRANLGRNAAPIGLQTATPEVREATSRDIKKGRYWPDELPRFGQNILLEGDDDEYQWDPPCDCIICAESFFSMEKQRTRFPQLAYRTRTSDHGVAPKYTREAKANQEYIKQRLATHGDVFMNRWIKRSREKRRAIILAADPDIHTERWYQPVYIYSNPIWTDMRNPIQRRHSLLPWMNLDSLSTNDMTLLALLRYRTLHSAQDWAPFDIRQTRWGWNFVHFDVQFSNKSVIMHGPDYGKIKAWDGRAVSWDAGAAHQGDTLGFPRARLVLEALANIMAFLRKVVDITLEGVETASGSEKWDALTIANFKNKGEIESWSPFTNQAFSAPPSFDVDVALSKEKCTKWARKIPMPTRAHCLFDICTRKFLDMNNGDGSLDS